VRYTASSGLKPEIVDVLIHNKEMTVWCTGVDGASDDSFIEWWYGPVKAPPFEVKP
jgi:hypothetical protein